MIVFVKSAIKAHNCKDLLEMYCVMEILALRWLENLEGFLPLRL